MNATELINERKLNMSYTDQEWRIERLAVEAKKHDRILQIEELNAATSRLLQEFSKANTEAFEHQRQKNAEADERQRKINAEAVAEAAERQRVNDAKNAEADERHRQAVAEAAERDRKFHEKMDAQNQGIVDVLNWQKHQNDSFEDLITSVLEKFLVKQGFVVLKTMDKKSRTILGMPPAFERGVQWDGVVYCSKDGAKFLYLVEAKSHLKEKAINGMDPRIERTEAFIKLCAEGVLPLKDSQIVMCNDWRLFAGATVRGAIGATAMTGNMLEKITKKGLLSVCSDLETYTVVDPVSGVTESGVTERVEDDSAD